MEGSKVAGEVRRINVVYFLSRNGNVEHPHLIRVHHFHRSGVHLKDVKRWLSELRGKDMPESFSWSYKRRYKTGYVWLDLMDDDLITPISDNEYVLKGSELLPRNDDHPLPFGAFSCSGHLEAAAEPEARQSPPLKTPPETLQIEPDDTNSPQPPPRLDQESPVPPTRRPSRSDTPKESAGRTAVFTIDMSKQQEEEKKKTKKERKQQAASSLGNATKHKEDSSSGRRATRVLRNLLGCRAVETKDSVLRSVNRHEEEEEEEDGLISRELSLGGSQRWRSFSSGRINQRRHQNYVDPTYPRKSWSAGGRSSRKTGEKPIPAAYKPVAEPNCSQCGKAFKPEKLYSHMKTCKALRARVKSSGNLEKQPLKAEIEELSKEEEASPSSSLTR